MTEKDAAIRFAYRRHKTRLKAICSQVSLHKEQNDLWRYSCACGWEAVIDQEDILVEQRRIENQTFNITQEVDPDRVAMAFADAIQEAAKPGVHCATCGRSEPIHKAHHWKSKTECPDCSSRKSQELYAEQLPQSREQVERRLEDVRLELGEGAELDRIAAKYGLKRLWEGAETDEFFRSRISDWRTRACNATRDDIVTGQRETIEYWKNVACELEKRFDERDKVLNEKIEELCQENARLVAKFAATLAKNTDDHRHELQAACCHERMRPSHRDGNALMDRCFDCGFESENIDEFVREFSGVVKIPAHKPGVQVYIQGDYLEDWE
jgi:hypothetical protein